MPRATSNASILSVRVTEKERQLLEDAASQVHTNLSEFVRRNALLAAEEELLERRVVIIPAEQWEALEKWMQAPARDNPALKKLANLTPVWER